MHRVLCCLTFVNLLLLASPLNAAMHVIATTASYTEQTIFGSDPGNFLLIGLGLLAVGAVGTRALRN